MTTSTPQKVQSNPIQYLHRGFQVISDPFRHEDDTFSLKFWILANGSLVYGAGDSRVEHSFTSDRDAGHAAMLMAQDWIDTHKELWKQRSE